MSEIPTIVLNYLSRHNMRAIDKDELDRLQNPPPAPGCPYPLFQSPAFGLTHDEYVGSICETEGELTSGLHVIRCAACGNVSFERPVAYS